MKNKPWYQQTTDELFANLETQEQGLTEGVVKERREKYGENKLAAKRQTTILQKFIAQFKVS